MGEGRVLGELTDIRAHFDELCPPPTPRALFKPGTQNFDSCTHEGNSAFQASSEYDRSYNAYRAFRGQCSSWSSSKFQAGFRDPQWIQMSLERPRKVNKIAFGGSPHYPDNTPTQYELQVRRRERRDGCHLAPAVPHLCGILFCFRYNLAQRIS